MKRIPSLRTILRLAAVLAVVAFTNIAMATPYATCLTNTGSTVFFRLNEAADSVQIISGAGLTTTNVIGPMTAGLKSTNLTIAGVFKVLVAKNGTNNQAQLGSTITVNSPRGVTVQNNPASGNFGRVYMANSANGTLGDGIYIYNADLSNPFGSQTNLRTAGINFATGGASSPMRIFIATNDVLYIGDWSDANGNLFATDADVNNYWYYVLGSLQANALTGLTGSTPVGIGADGRTNNHGSVYVAYATGSTNTGDLKVYTTDEDYQQDPESANLTQMNSVWLYDIGAGPLPWTNPPTRLLCVPSIQFVSQNADFTIGPNGFIYVNQRRANASKLPGGTYTPSLFVVDPNKYIDPTNYNGLGFWNYTVTTNNNDPDPPTYTTNFDYYAMYDPTNLPNVINPVITNYLGVPLYTLASNYTRHASSGGHIWDSQSASSDMGSAFADLFSEANGVAVSPDGKYIAAITFGGITGQHDANDVKIARLTNGIPDLTRFWKFATGSTVAAGRGVAWDAADNLYFASSGGAYMKAWNFNFASKALTGSDGTFSIETPPNEVWISVPDGLAAEGTPATDTATFTFWRDGDLSAPLTVNYTITGTAANGTDYTNILGGNLGTSVTFAAGAATTNITIVPIDDTTLESPETIILTVAGNVNYTTLYNKSATAVIAENEQPEMSIVPVFTNMYERVPNDFVRFQLIRRGFTNVAFNVNLTYSGVTDGVDFSGPAGSSQIFVNAGVTTQNFDLNPIDNSNVTGNRPFTVTIAAAGGGEYSIGTTNSAAGMIIDDDQPAESVIWSDNFDAYAGTGANVLPADWTFTFGTTNTTSNPADYDFEFGYNYAGAGLPDPPNGGGTYIGLKATVNKHLSLAAAAGWAAGIDFYPTNHPAFTNDYAFRFNMLLVVPSATNQTEHAIFGINHSDTGSKTNWFSASSTVLNGADQDGMWFGVNNVGGNSRDFALYTKGTTATAPLVLSNRLATTLNQTFKTPPYFGAGLPGISQTTTPSPTWTWLDVEVAQTTNMITLRLNNTLIIQTTNITAFKSGNIMVGYNDQFNSIGGDGGSVIYDNLRVIAISPPVILAQPESLVRTNGTAASFSVTASTGTGVTNYQWLLNGNPIAGATSATYNLASVAFANYGTYTVVVDDGRYPVTSATATLLPPAAGMGFGVEAASRVVPFGLGTSLASTAFTSSGTTNYQWMMGSPLTNVSGANYTGITTATLGITGVRATNVGPFRLRVSDGFNAITGTPATVSLALQPTIANGLSGSTFNLTFPTEIGPKYVLEWKGALTNGAWNQMVTNDGTGSPITVTDNIYPDLLRFYRIRMQ